MLEEQIGELVDNRKDIVQEQCRVCGDPAAGFHFGVFTCEGCKSFFGRAHQKKLLSECKNKGKCDVNRNTRTKCKLCRLQKCLSVGMSKEASRYGRRSTYFKVHCMAEKQAKQKLCKTESLSLIDSDSSGTSPSYVPSLPPTPAAISANSNLASVEKIISNSPFPTRPVPCYPTYSPFGYNPFLYFTPVNLSSHVNIIGQKSSFSFNNYSINEQQPQSTPLDLSQKSSRINNGKFKVVDDSSSTMIIKKAFDFNHHHHHHHHHHHNHSTNHFQVSSIEAVL